MYSRLYLFLCWVLVLGVPLNAKAVARKRMITQKNCEPQEMKIEMCKSNSKSYAYTSFPNFHDKFENQNEANNQLVSFQSLVNYGCSNRLSFFLCSVYAPMCDKEQKVMVPPCRPLCEHVRSRCDYILRKFNITWPPPLDCDQYPISNTVEMCMEGPNGPETNYGVHSTVDQLSLKMCKGKREPRKYIFLNQTNKCVPACENNILFSYSDKHVAEVWMGILAGMCFVSSFFTFLTYLIDSSRFRYPERPVVYLAVCYNFYSISYFIRLFSGRQNIICAMEPYTGRHLTIQSGLDNTACAISFMFDFYFSMASSVWWVMLTITWLLAADLKWSDEAIHRRSSYIHVVAWTLPAILTVAAILNKAVDADELLGMCSVGQTNSTNLMTFVIAPKLILLLIGFICLFSGFIALTRIWRHVRNDGIRTDKLEVLMVRIGLFSLLYILPALCVVGCNIYEYVNRDDWLSSDKTSKPNIEVFMLKTFMSLVVGITSGMWIWSAKTFQSWKMFCTCATQLPGAKALIGGGPLDRTNATSMALVKSHNGAAGMVVNAPRAGPGVAAAVHGGGDNYYGGARFWPEQLPPGYTPVGSSGQYSFPKYDVKYNVGNGKRKNNTAGGETVI